MSRTRRVSAAERRILDLIEDHGGVPPVVEVIALLWPDLDWAVEECRWWQAQEEAYRLVDAALSVIQSPEWVPTREQVTQALRPTDLGVRAWLQSYLVQRLPVQGTPTPDRLALFSSRSPYHDPHRRQPMRSR